MLDILEENKDYKVYRLVRRKYGNLFILRQRLRRKGQRFVRMGQYLLPFQVCHDLVKYRIDGFPFRTLREGFQDCHFPAFICRESNGTIRMSQMKTYAVLKESFLSGEAGSVEQISAFKKSVTGRVIPKRPSSYPGNRQTRATIHGLKSRPRASS